MRIKIASGPSAPQPARRRVKVASGTKQPEALPLKRDGIVNAFHAGNSVILVRPDGSFSRAPARLSAYIKTPDLTADHLRALRGHRGVKSIQRDDAGGWTCIDFVDRDWRERLCTQLEEFGLETYEGDLSAVLRYLVDEEPVIAAPRPVYLDIETDSRVPFTKKEQARILCWALVDEDEKTVATGLLEADTDEAEAALLMKLWRALEPFHQIRTWNGDRFDKPVILARTLKVHGLPINPSRWLWLDHLEQFKRSNMMAAESGEEKQSYSLNAVAMALLGEGKHDFDASKTWEAWSAGGAKRQELLDYCVQDTRLMPKIEAETGYCSLLSTIAEVCGIFADSKAVNPQNQVEALMLRLYKRRAMKPRTRFYKPDQVREQFKGAFVMQPKGRGILRDVHVCDFASLYPSIIISFNISPETRQPRPLDPNAGRPSYLPALPYNPDAERLPGCANAPLTLHHFSQEIPGILAEAIAEMIALRKEWNDRKSKYPPGTPEWKECDRRSTAYKIAANSFYGVVGAPTSRFFDRASAEAVTQVGVWLLELTIKAAEARGLRVVYGDTDSCFIMGCTDDEFGRFVDWCNTSLYPQALLDRGATRNKVKLAYEKAFARLVFVSAKRYVGRYSHYKGTAATVDSKPEIRGLEYKRGDVLRMARDMQLEAIHHLLQVDAEPDPDAAHAIVERWRAGVLEGELVLADFLQAKTLSKPLSGYKIKPKKDGTASAQPPHVMVAQELKRRGRDVGEGTKVAYFCADGAAKQKRYLPAEDWELGVEGKDVDRYELWESAVYPPTQRLLEAAFPAGGWDKWEKARPPKQRKGGKAKVGTADRDDLGPLFARGQQLATE